MEELETNELLAAGLLWLVTGDEAVEELDEATGAGELDEEADEDLEEVAGEALDEERIGEICTEELDDEVGGGELEKPGGGRLDDAAGLDVAAGLDDDAAGGVVPAAEELAPTDAELDDTGGIGADVELLAILMLLELLTSSCAV